MTAQRPGALDHLAEEVVATLQKAGLPACFQEDAPADQAGAVVDVDAGADAVGGVYVQWHTHPQLEATLRRALLAQDFSGPDVEFAAVGNDTLPDAMIQVLRAGGLRGPAGTQPPARCVHI